MPTTQDRQEGKHREHRGKLIMDGHKKEGVRTLKGPLVGTLMYAACSSVSTVSLAPSFGRCSAATCRKGKPHDWRLYPH